MSGTELNEDQFNEILEIIWNKDKKYLNKEIEKMKKEMRKNLEYEKIVREVRELEFLD